MTEIKPAQKWLPGTDSIGNSRSRLFRIYELMWDVFLMIPSYFVSQLLFRGHPPSTFFLLGIGSASCALSYVFCGLFSAKHSQRGIEILIETFKLNLLGFVFAALFIWLTNLELATIILEILILQSMLLFTVSLMLGCFFRMILFSATKVSGADPYSSRALILCQSSDLHSIYEKLERSKGKNYEYAGALTIDGNQDWTTGIKILGALEDLEQVIRTEVIDDVIIVIRNFQSLDIQPYIEVCEKAGLGVHVLFDFATRALQKRFSVAGEYVSLSFCNNRLTPLQLFAKRALDIVGSIVGLIITGFVAIVIGPKIKKDKGPVFFSQIRVGENG
ncbi:MAG: sugar transferase, partial [Clostridiales bacterium]|nr:sugar transferase [Clostridiales bacterium]